MTQTVNTAMKENGRRAWKGAAFVLSVLVYLAGLIYAGVRSFDLFARTVPPDLLPLAVLGILALELTALALPLALHYWTAPGPQRYAAMAFYVADLLLITANAILDAAQQAGTLLPAFMTAYGVYAVPALPVVCMVGWAIVWALDPASREADMRATVQAATQEALMGQMIEATKAIDITDAVQQAAAAAARALVGETLGRAPRGIALPEAGVPTLAPPARAGVVGGHTYNAQAPAWSATSHRPPDDSAAEHDQKVKPGPVQAAKATRNGTRKGASADGPKA